MIFFSLICDKNGKISEFSWNGGTEVRFERIFEIADAGSQNRLEEFLSGLAEGKKFSESEIRLSEANGNSPFSIAGINRAPDFLVFGMQKDGVLEKLIDMSDRQLGELRRTLKEVSQLKATHEILANQVGTLTNDLAHLNRQLSRKNKELEFHSTTDDLTGLYNRRHLMETADGEIRRARRYGEKLAFVMIDLDEFKSINDEFGHGKGDEILKEFSNALYSGIRGDLDKAFRIGGDEFLLMLIQTDEKEAAEVIGRIRKKVDFIGFSSGIKCIDGRTGEGIDQVLKSADELMYREKKNHREKET